MTRKGLYAVKEKNKTEKTTNQSKDFVGFLSVYIFILSG